MKKVYKEKGVRLYLDQKQQRKLICLLYQKQQELVSIGGNTKEEFENKVEEYEFIKTMLDKLRKKECAEIGNR